MTNRLQVVSVSGNATGDTTVSYLGPDNSQTLVYNSSGASSTEFGVTTIWDTDGSSTVLNSGDDRFKINIDVRLIGSDTGLEESESAELEFVTRSGAKTLYQFQIPTALEGSSVVKL